MMTTERTLAPQFKTIDNVEMIQAQKTMLNSSVELYEINAGTQELVKVELLFEAGSRFQKIPLQAYAANTLLNEGTPNYSSEAIAELIDYYGAFLHTDVDKDYATVTLYSLNKHLPNVLPLLKEIITQSNYPQQELDTFIQNEKQRFLVDQKKVSFVARKHFNEMLFGGNHPYGYNLQIEDYDKIDRDSILEFTQSFYHAGNCKIIMAGKIGEPERNLVSDFFGNKWKSEKKIFKSESKINLPTERNKLIYKEDALQSAIRIGRVLFKKNHPDYFGMQMLNTVLGGYFGSRLMANIREDKGYTYGIGSGIISMKETGNFFISTEVGVDVCNDAINEIYFEIKRLREELISEEELELVRNYMMGVFLKNVDGPFALSDRLKNLLENELDYTYYDKYIENIKTIKSSNLRDLANQYLQQDDLIELVVGKR